MYDLEKIDKRINDINRFFSDLNKIDINEKSIKDSTKKHATAMLMLGIITRTIDIAEEILVENDLPMPQRYKDTFEELGKKGLIDKKICVETGKIIEKRNIFAHHYYDVNEKEILKTYKDINVVKNFIDEVKKEVERKAKEK